MTKERTTSTSLDAPAVLTLTSRHTAEALWFNRGCWSILADSKSTGGSYCVFEVEMPQGVVDEPHIHDHADKAYYVFDGTLDFFVDSEVHRLDKGSFIFIPRGADVESLCFIGRICA
jgi:quercetin dioxygenase-like cupin family protein